MSQFGRLRLCDLTRSTECTEVHVCKNRWRIAYSTRASGIIALSEITKEILQNRLQNLQKRHVHISFLWSMVYLKSWLHLAQKDARIFVRRRYGCFKTWTKTVSFEEQIISKEKYRSIFSRQMEAIVFIIFQIFLNKATQFWSNAVVWRSKHFHPVKNVQ